MPYHGFFIPFPYNINIMKAINHKAAKKTFLRDINQNNNPDLIYAENNVSLNLPQTNKLWK